MLESAKRKGLAALTFIMNRKCYKNFCIGPFLLCVALGSGQRAQAQTTSSQPKLSVQWEELTGPDFVEAIKRSQGTCLLPFGILEKHGPHMPIGTDLINVRYVALHAAEQQYAVVFPQYYFGQISEARHEPGTIAYSRDLQLALLQATTDEMARNGCKKILIVNGHGGNASLLPYFAQSQLDKPHDYVVYLIDQRTPTTGGPKRKTTDDQHAGESETSKMMIVRPDLLHMERATSESGADQHRQNLPHWRTRRKRSHVVPRRCWPERPGGAAGRAAACRLRLGMEPTASRRSRLPPARHRSRGCYRYPLERGGRRW